jgi:hypothetical protein
MMQMLFLKERVLLAACLSMQQRATQRTTVQGLHHSVREHKHAPAAVPCCGSAQ